MHKTRGATQEKPARKIQQNAHMKRKSVNLNNSKGDRSYRGIAIQHKVRKNLSIGNLNYSQDAGSRPGTVKNSEKKAISISKFVPSSVKNSTKPSSTISTSLRIHATNPKKPSRMLKTGPKGLKPCPKLNMHQFNIAEPSQGVGSKSPSKISFRPEYPRLSHVRSKAEFSPGEPVF